MRARLQAMSNPQQLTRPTVLTEPYAIVARGLIDVYFGKAQTKAFDGASFETIGHRWDDPATVNVITAADLVALSTLSVPVPASAAIALLGPDADKASKLLEEIPTDLSLADATSGVLEDGSAAARLWRLFRSYDDMGPTRTSKLLARKRPFLVPIFDSVVEKTLGMSGSAGHWEGMRSLLTAQDSELHGHLLQLRADAELPDYVSPLRVFDIVVWMHGARPELSARLAAEAGLPPAA